MNAIFDYKAPRHLEIRIDPRVMGKIHRSYLEHVESVFVAVICAVCGDMPTYEHFQSMGRIFISPDGTRTLTWGGNVIASVPPPHIYRKQYQSL